MPLGPRPQGSPGAQARAPPRPNNKTPTNPVKARLRLTLLRLTGICVERRFAFNRHFRLTDFEASGENERLHEMDPLSDDLVNISQRAL